MIGEHCDAPDTPQGTIRSPHCFCFAEIRRSRLDGQTPALRAANPTRKQHRGVEPDRCAVSTSPRTSKGQLLYSIGKPQATFIFSFSQEGDLVRWAPRSRFLHAHVRCAVMAPSPKAPVLPVWQVHLLNGHTSFVFEHRLSAGTRVTSHHGILHDFHHQLLHPAPLMNSPSSSTCSHLLLVTSSHLDFPGGVMNRLSSPVGVLAP